MRRSRLTPSVNVAILVPTPSPLTPPLFTSREKRKTVISCVSFVTRPRSPARDEFSFVYPAAIHFTPPPNVGSITGEPVRYAYGMTINNTRAGNSEEGSRLTFPSKSVTAFWSARKDKRATHAHRTGWSVNETTRRATPVWFYKLWLFLDGAKGSTESMLKLRSGFRAFNLIHEHSRETLGETSFE